MSDKKTDASRRTLLKGIALMPVAVALGHTAAAYAENLDPNDPTAQALGYEVKSTHEGQHCGVCALYQGGTAATGACPIFGGKDVHITGWCKSFAPKG